MPANERLLFFFGGGGAERLRLLLTCITGVPCPARQQPLPWHLALMQAWLKMRESSQDWYFCRGYFRQNTNSFEAYTDKELGVAADDGERSAPCMCACRSMRAAHVASNESHDMT